MPSTAKAPTATASIPPARTRTSSWATWKPSSGVVKFPVRIKCATLSWNTLLQGLDEQVSP